MRKTTARILIFAMLVSLFNPVWSALAAPGLTVLDAANTNLNSDDAPSGSISIGFDFEFFDNEYNSLYLNANGMLNFGSPATAPGNVAIPNINTPNNFIAPFWDDLTPTRNLAGSPSYLRSIYYTTAGSAPNRQFIVQWTDMYFFGTTIPMGTFQAILFEGTNEIQFQYNYLVNSTCDGRALGASATIGLENADGDAGVQFSFNEMVLTSGDALLFTPDNGSYTVDTNPIFLNYLLRDTTAASVPALTAPVNQATVSNPLNFEWGSVPNVSYSLQVSDSPDFTSFVIYKQGMTDTVLESVYLSGSMDYYWRVGSTNLQGTHYSDTYTFTTDNSFPTVSTGAISEVLSVTASVYGFVQEGLSEIVEYGHVWSTGPNPTLSEHALKTSFTQVNGDYMSQLTGLNGNTKYYVNSYVTTQSGTIYGSETCFTTSLASSNSSLAQLELSSGTLSPVFDSATLKYTADVPNNVSNIHLTPTAADSRATVTVNNEAVISGQASQAIPLVVGVNTVMVVITAENGTPRTYELEVTRGSAPPSSSSSSSVPPPSRQVKVVTEGLSSFVQVDIARTEEAGRKVDRVQFERGKAEEIIRKASEIGENIIRIIIDELPNDAADEIVAEVSTEALGLLSSSGLSLEIEASGVTISLNSASLLQLNQDGEKLIFRIVPVRDAQAAKSITDSILQDKTLTSEAGNGAKAASAPLTIETNYSGPVTNLIFSLNGVEAPDNQQERELFFRSLGMFIRHSDGDKKFVYGELVRNAEGEINGYRITVDKFSTFTFVAAEILERAAYISGYPDGRFKPDDKVTRAQLAVMLASALGAHTTAEARFNDLAPDHWAALAIAQVNKLGLMIGDPDRGFRPNAEITRAEMASIAARVSHSETSNRESAFSDISGHWAAEAIDAVDQAGIMSGYAGGSFRPNQTLTRAEAVKVVNKLLGRRSLTEVAGSSWSDVSSAHWALGDIEAASGNYFSILHGEGRERVIKQK